MFHSLEEDGSAAQIEGLLKTCNCSTPSTVIPNQLYVASIAGNPTILPPMPVAFFKHSQELAAIGLFRRLNIDRTRVADLKKSFLYLIVDAKSCPMFFNERVAIRKALISLGAVRIVNYSLHCSKKHKLYINMHRDWKMQ